jgi:hypothetical protein
MEIDVKGTVNKVMYATNSRYNTAKLSSLTEYQLPNQMELYLDYKFIFPCFSCGQEIVGGYFDRKWHYIARFDMSFENYGVTEVIDSLSTLFDLQLVDLRDEAGDLDIYYYKLNNHPCSITYDRCPHCHGQFMLCDYANGAGDVGRVGYIYMAPIKFITCNEKELLHWAAKSKLDNRSINPDYSGPF